MNPFNVATTSAPPPVANSLSAKRKRGRPRKDSSMTQPESTRVTTTPRQDVDMVGRAVSGVVEESFEAGFIINVKVKDSDMRLRGLVFGRGKVVPVTPENDVAPNVKMIVREKIKNRTDHDCDQSCPPNDQTMEDDVEMSECARALILLPHGGKGLDPKEVMEERDAATSLVEFFQTPETTMVVPAQQNLALAQKEHCESSGFDLMAEDLVGTRHIEWRQQQQQCHRNGDKA